MHILHTLHAILERTFADSIPKPKASEEKPSPQAHFQKSKILGEYQTLAHLEIPGHFILYINYRLFQA